MSKKYKIFEIREKYIVRDLCNTRLFIALFYFFKNYDHGRPIRKSENKNNDGNVLFLVFISAFL